MIPNDPVATINPLPTAKPLKHIIEYYPNSNTKFREYNLNENNQYHGLYKEWNLNNQLWIKCTYHNGVRHGLYERWHFDGSLRYRFFYNNGKIES
jgi:hypothetical protein